MLIHHRPGSHTRYVVILKKMPWPKNPKMEIEVKYVSGAFVIGSKIIVDVFARHGLLIQSLPCTSSGEM